MSVIPENREAEFQRLSEDFYRARGMDHRGDHALTYLMCQAYLLGKSDGMERSQQIWRETMSELKKRI
jgi:hypothetical protein